MSLPPGVIGVQVNAVPSTTGPATNPVVSVTPSMNLIWSATGTSLASCCTGNSPIPGWIVLPAVDQAGWITPDTRTGVTGWTYLVTVSFTVAGTPITVSGAIQVFQDQSVDYVTDAAGVLTAAAEYPIGGLALNTWVPTYASLPSGLTAAQAGYTAICQADDLVYVWSGSAWPASGHGFPVDGPVGGVGSTGPAGPANSLSIGTVTSGTAAASIGGTPPTQTLNLTLPAGPTGATGGVGPTGSVGATGTRGSDWFTGSGAPGTVGGAISGDYYLDTSGTGNYYSYNGTTWTLAGSLLGPTGATGASSTWHVGTGVPGSGLGVNGDMYLNTATGDVYGPKTAGAWGSIQENIVGPSAPQATSGTQGTIQLGGGDLGGSATAVTVPGKVPYFAPVTKTANYTMAANDFVAANASGGTFTVTFPTAPADKTRVAVKKIDSSTNAVSLALGGSDVFNIASGPTTGSLALQNQALIAQYSTTGAIWYVQSTDVPLGQLDSRYVAQTTNVTAGTGLSGGGALSGSVSLAVAYGTGAGTAAQGNDSRITGAAPAASPTITGTFTLNASTLAGSAIATAAAASTLAERDSNANLTVNNLVESYNTTTTSSTTQTLTAASAPIQFYTGSTAQPVTLPVASTLTEGWSTLFVNNSTATVTVSSSGSNSVVAIPAGGVVEVVCILNSGTSAGSWSALGPFAPLASPAFTGTVTVPTPTTADNTTKAASTAYVQSNLSSYLTTSSASSTYAPLASPTFTGTPLSVTPTTTDSSTKIATTAYVQAQTVPMFMTFLVQGGTRQTGYGDMPCGFLIPVAMTVTKFQFRIDTADASGTNSAQIYTNTTGAATGSALASASISSVAWTTAPTVSSVTGTWNISANTYLQCNVTAVGTTPGSQLYVDVIGTVALAT